MKIRNILIKCLSGIIPLMLIGCLLLGPGGCASDGRDSGGTIWGTMRSAINPDRGVSNAFVSLDGKNIFALTAGNGYFSIMGVPEGNYDVTITKYGQELYKGSTSINRSMAFTDPSPARFNDFSTMVQFQDAVPGDKTLAATILDPEGKPVTGAEIDLIYKNPNAFYVADTDIGGSFYFENIQPDPDLLIIEAEGFKPAIFGTGVINSFVENGSQGALVNLIPIEKEAPSSIDFGKVHGTVHDNSGSLAGGMKVALIPIKTDINPVDSIARIITTSDIGEYTFLGVDPGDYIVWVGGPNHFATERKITLEPNGDVKVDVTLKEASNRDINPIFSGQGTL